MLWFQSPVFNCTFWTHEWKRPLDFVYSPFNASVLHEHLWKVIITSLQWNMLVTVNSFLFLSTNPLYLLHFRRYISKKCCHDSPCTFMNHGFLQTKLVCSEAPGWVNISQVCGWDTIYVLHQAPQCTNLPSTHSLRAKLKVFSFSKPSSFFLSS